ncbi:MAG: hypothetical protein N2C14_06530, partial [Planctomycetales bacterium]
MGETELAFRATQQNAMLAWSWGAFLICAACGIGLSRRLAILIAAVGLSAAIALLVPASWSSAASATVLGFSVGLVRGLAWRNRLPVTAPISEDETANNPPSTTSLVIGSLAIMFVALAAGRVIHAQPAAEPPRTVYPVYVPVDEKKVPVPSKKYLVPLDFYRALRLETERLKRPPRGWIVGSARYVGSLGWDPLDKRFTLSRLKARFQLTVWSGEDPIRLRLGGEGLQEPPLVATLDGREISLAVGDDGLLEIEPLPPGSYQLEIPLRPQARSVDGRSTVDFQIPPAPDSRLELTLAPQSPSVEVVSAVGARHWNEASRLLTVDLGPTSRLTAHWREAELGEMKPEDVSVSQLQWLKVSAGNAVLEVRFQFQVGRGAARSVRFETDPRLRLLRVRQPDDAPETRIRDLGGTPRVYEATFAKPVSGSFSVEPSFLLEGTSGVGNLRPPRVEALGVELTKRWMAVSIDPSLETTPPKAEREVPLEAFQQAWGAAELSPPVFKVYDLRNDPAPLWSLATRPREAGKQAEQILWLTVKPRRIDVRLDAWIRASSAPSFQHGFHCPANWIVERVTCDGPDARGEARWFRTAPEELTVLFQADADVLQRVRLEGWLPAPTQGSLELPAAWVKQAELTGAKIVVRNSPETQVEIESLEDLQPIDPAELVADFPSGLATAAWEVASKEALSARSYGAVLRVSPNRPRLRAVQTTVMSREGAQWLAEIQIQVHGASDGATDSLQFDLPSTWNGPFQATPDADIRVDAGRDGSRQLTVRFPETILLGFHATIRSPLTIPSGARVTVPAIHPVESIATNHYVVLPREIEGQLVSWSVHGLREVDLLPETAVPPRGPVRVYRAGKRFRAALRSTDQTNKKPRVRLADVAARYDSEGVCHAVAALDFDPAGRAQCVLELPPRARLRLIQLDGRPLRAAPSGKSQWTFDVGAGQYPHRLDVMYSAPESRSHWRQTQLVTPKLVDFPVDRTLWTLSSPPGSLADSPFA